MSLRGARKGPPGCGRRDGGVFVLLIQRQSRLCLHPDREVVLRHPFRRDGAEGAVDLLWRCVDLEVVLSQMDFREQEICNVQHALSMA